jgi:quercetin dioxygenase-like cupin family protein
VKIVRVEEITVSERAAQFVGKEHGATVSFFLTSHPRGEGPDPHRHPYEETFIVQGGTVTFTVDGRQLEANAGDIVVVPAGAVHSFKGSSDERARQVTIHPVPEMRTEWIA